MGLFILLFAANSCFGQANDAFADRTVITDFPATLNGSNFGATKEPHEPHHAGYPGGRSVWWTWTATTDGTVMIDTIGSSFDTVLAVYMGESLAMLSSIAADDDGGLLYTSSVRFEAVSGTAYHIAVDGFGGMAGEIVLTLRSNPPVPPNDLLEDSIPISGIPVAVTGYSFGASTESLSVDDFPFFAFRSVWWTWTAPIDGDVTVDTIGSSFDTLLAVLLGDPVTGLTLIGADDESGIGGTSSVAFNAVSGTSYHIWVDGYAGETGHILLNIKEGPQGDLSPPNDAFDNRVSLDGLPITSTGVNFGATKESEEPDHATEAGGSSVWWTWTAPADGQITIDTVGSTFDTLLAVYTGNSIPELTLVAADDDRGGRLTSSVAFNAVANSEYHIAVDGFEGDQGKIVIDIRPGLPAPPVFELSPLSLRVLEGEEARFYVSIDGKFNSGYSYQWLHNGEPIPGETSSYLEIWPVRPDHAGNYSVVVSDGVTSAASPTALLVVDRAVLFHDLGYWPDDERFYCRDLAIRGEHAYLIGDGLLVLDLTDPSGPVEIGRRYTDGDRIKVAGDMAYVVSGTLDLIDISDPSWPMYISSYYPSGTSARDVTIVDTFAFLAAGYAGLEIVDVSDSFEPQLYGKLPTDGFATSITVTNDIAYLATTSGLAIIDVSDPSNPVLLGSYLDVYGATDIEVQDELAYLAMDGDGLMILDVSDPYEPAFVGYTATHDGHATGISVSPGRVYVNTRTGLEIIDVSDPSVPHSISRYAFQDVGDEEPLSHYGYRYGIDLIGNVVFAATGGLEIVDVTDPVEPVRGADLPDSGTWGRAQAVDVVGDIAYVADGADGLQILDVTDLQDPRPTGRFNTAGHAKDVIVQGNYAFVADGSTGLLIIDVSDPANPVLAGSYDTPGIAEDLLILGDLAFIADGPAGATILDISNPAQPVLVGTYATWDHARALDVSGDFMYIDNGVFGFDIVDVSDPADPVWVGPEAVDGAWSRGIGGIHVIGDLAFVTSSSRFKILDISDPGTITELADYSSSYDFEDFQIVGNFAYVAGGERGLQVLDVSDPALVGRAGSASTFGYATSVRIVDGVVFVADSTGGLLIFRASEPGAGLPVILEQPLDQLVAPGTEITFSVTVSGSPPFSYQWQHDGEDIPGATNDSYTVIASEETVGDYRVVVSNDAGSVTSATALLQLVSNEADLSVTMTAQPESATVSSNLVFTITVTNHGPTDAAGVTLTNALPPNFDLLSVTSSQGTHITNTAELVFTLDALAANGVAAITIEGTCGPPGPNGSIVYIATVGSQILDPIPANNQVVLELPVTLPPLPMTIQFASSDPEAPLTLTIPLLPGYDAFIEYTDSLAPDTPWLRLSDTPVTTGVVNLSNETATRFYRIVLIPR